jgi:hypothetical protein
VYKLIRFAVVLTCSGGNVVEESREEGEAENKRELTNILGTSTIFLVHERS